jgi:hypothetical protein
MKDNSNLQSEPCAKFDYSMRPSSVAEGNGSPLIPREICDTSPPNRKLEHETQADFLKALIAYEDNEVNLELRSSLAKADREGKYIRYALFSMATLFILSVAGLVYCAVLLPQVFANPTHFVTKGLSVLVLASLISQFEFVGYMLWQRSAVNRLHKECRRRVLLLVESQLSASLRRGLGVGISRELGSAIGSVPARDTGRPSPEQPV